MRGSFGGRPSDINRRRKKIIEREMLSSLQGYTPQERRPPQHWSSPKGRTFTKGRNVIRKERMGFIGHEEERSVLWAPYRKKSIWTPKTFYDRPLLRERLTAWKRKKQGKRYKNQKKKESTTDKPEEKRCSPKLKLVGKNFSE